MDRAADQSGSHPFSRLDAFLKAHPDHPAANRFSPPRRGSLLSERKSAPVVRSFFQCRQPLSPAGRIALAVALKADGKADEALALVAPKLAQGHPQRAGGKDRSRPVRRCADAGGPPAAHGAPALPARTARRHDAAQRASRPIMEARRAPPRPAPGTRAAARGPDRQAAGLPARGALLHLPAGANARRADRLDDAAGPWPRRRAIRSVSATATGWWRSGAFLARKLLDAGKAQQAYEVAAGHGAEDLRSGSRPNGMPASSPCASSASRAGAGSFRGGCGRRRDAHFRRPCRLLARPRSCGPRAGRGRERRLGRAAEQPIAYYGQLARARLGLPDLPLRLGDASRLAALPGHRGCACSTGWAKKTWPG